MPTQQRKPSLSWTDHRKLLNTVLPYELRNWLLDPRSLTARLIKASKGKFGVQVLSQSWQCATASESALLGINIRTRCLIRETLLLCDGVPWVYARSIMPTSSLTGRLRHLRKFGSQPLGQLLFNTPRMRRCPFEVSRDSIVRFSKQPLALQAADNSQLLWGRRSRFEIFHKPLIVSEIFLPAFRP